MVKSGPTKSQIGSQTQEPSNNSIGYWAKLVAELQPDLPQKISCSTVRPTGPKLVLINPIGSGTHPLHSKFYERSVDQLKSSTETQLEQTNSEETGQNSTE